MISRRSRNPRAEGEILARFRPIAPRPANVSSSSTPPIKPNVPAAPPFPDSRLSSAKRSRSSPCCSSAAPAPLKKLKSLPGASSCSSLRPLIPVTKPSTASSRLTQDHGSSDLLSSARCELKTLALLPDGSSATAAPQSPGSDSSLTSPQRIIDPDARLTELSLGSTLRSLEVDSSREKLELGIPSWRHFDNLLFERSALPMAVTDAQSGGILWSNPAFSAARDGDLRHPVPLISFTLTEKSQGVMWIFGPSNASSGVDFFPMKPQAVRASIASGVLESLAAANRL